MEEETSESRVEGGDEGREARMRERRKKRLAEGKLDREAVITGVRREDTTQKSNEPTAASFFVGGRLLRQREEYGKHSASWALRETLKKGSFVVVMILIWHFGRMYAMQEKSAAVVWTTDSGSAIFTRRLAFIQSAESKLRFHKGDVVAAYSSENCQRLVRAVIVEDSYSRSNTGDLTWKLVPYVARDCSNGSYFNQGKIVGRIDFSLSLPSLAFIAAAFSLYTWWALTQ